MRHVAERMVRTDDSVKMLLALALFAVILVLWPADEPQAQTTRSGAVPVSGEMLTVADTAIGITASVITPGSATSPVSRCIAKLETAAIRYWASGATPTTSAGILVNTGETIELVGARTIAQFRGIRTTGTSGTLAVQCERQ